MATARACTRSACRSPGRRRRRRCSPGCAATRRRSTRSAGTAFFCKDFVTFRLTGRRVSRHLRHERRRLRCACRTAATTTTCSTPTASPTPRTCCRRSSGRPTSPARSPPRPRPPPGSPRARRWSPGSSTWWRARSARASVAPGEASIIAGTWSINQVIAARADRRPRASSWSRLRPRTAFMAIESSATSAANLEWYVRELVERGGHHDGSVRRLQPPRGRRSRRRPTTPTSIPSSTARGEGAFMRAGFYGIAGWHGEGHLLRALFEGVAFEHRRHVDVLRSAGVRFDTRHALRRRRPQRRSGRRCSPTSSASRSRSPPAPRPARSAPPSPRASGVGRVPRSRGGRAGDDPATRRLRPRPRHGRPLRASATAPTACSPKR